MNAARRPAILRGGLELLKIRGNPYFLKRTVYEIDQEISPDWLKVPLQGNPQIRESGS